jgi:type IV pilus assembly protein PilC
MVEYKYKARDEHGKTVTATMQANDEIDLHERLKAEHLLLVSAQVKGEEKTAAKRLKSNVISEFSRNIGELVSSGVTIVRALRIVSEDESIKPNEREIYNRVLKEVLTGIPLSDALEHQGEAFPPLFISMMRSAETSGNMDVVALQMATYYDKDYRMKQRVKSAMTYPKILAVLTVLVVIIIMAYIIPQFQSLFDQMESLPVTTQILLAISNFVKTRWYIIMLLIAVLVMVFKLLFSMPKVRYLKDKALVHMPMAGKLMKVIYTARFARTLASLYTAGISIINCLTIARTTIDNTYIEQQFDAVIAEVRAGNNLSDALERVDGFTKKLVSSVSVGEETGSLDTMLVSIADQMEYDSELSLNKLVSYLEPVMLVVMAIIVGFIMVSVIQPIYGSYEQISNSYK